MEGKRTHSDAMETKEEENPEITKIQKTKFEGQLLEVIEPEVEKNKRKVKGSTFEVQEYEFSEVLETSTNKFKPRADLYDKYKNDREIPLKESSKLYSKVRNISSKEVSLVTVKDHTRSTFNLVVSTKNRIA